MAVTKVRPSLKPKSLRSPRAINHCVQDAWWYEDKYGIEILSRDKHNGNIHQIRVLWSELIPAMKRCAVKP